jgi:hypothetical protein
MSKAQVSNEWMKIAAQMIEAKSASVDSTSTPDEVKAMAWLFDNGVFYLSDDGMSEFKDALLSRYAELSAHPTQPPTTR